LYFVIVAVCEQYLNSYALWEGKVWNTIAILVALSFYLVHFLDKFIHSFCCLFTIFVCYVSDL